MRTVVPVATTELAARAYFAREWAHGWIISSEQEALVLDRSLAVIERIDLGIKPEDLALSSDGALLVVAGGGALSAIDVRSRRRTWTVRGNFLACRNLGDSVWAAAGLAHDIELSLRDVNTGRARTSTSVADPFGDSAAMLFPHPNTRSVVAWVAAGQDGQTAYLAIDDGSTINATEIAPRDRLPPIFLTEDMYISAGDDVLERLTWPYRARASAVSWPGIDDDDDPAGSDVHALPGGFVSWSSSNGRIFIVDLDGMCIVDELVIAGHPVIAIEELYPTLDGDRTPCTDFGYAEPGSDGLILTVHGRTQLAISRLADWSPNPSRCFPTTESMP